MSKTAVIGGRTVRFESEPRADPGKPPEREQEQEIDMTDTDEPGAGHNSVPADAEIKSYFERIMRLEDEKAEIAEQIKEVKAEAKANGFTPAVLAKMVSRAKKDRDKVLEDDEMLYLYERAAGLKLANFV